MTKGGTERLCSALHIKVNVVLAHGGETCQCVQPVAQLLRSVQHIDQLVTIKLVMMGLSKHQDAGDR